MGTGDIGDWASSLGQHAPNMHSTCTRHALKLRAGWVSAGGSGVQAKQGSLPMVTCCSVFFWSSG